MPHRAFCEDLSSAVVVLTDAEAHHLLHVLRAKPGDVIELFDGQGFEAQAVIRSTGRRDASCEVTALSRTEHAPRPEIAICCSPPKGERLKWMVEKLTEIGVDRLRLIRSQRTVVVTGETRLDRLRSAVIAACKQSGRSILMDVQTLTAFEDVISASETNLRPIRLIAHPGDGSRTISAVLATTDRNRPIEILIGPEGGFSDDEVSLAVRAGAIPVAWPGGCILRTETAAIAFATILIHSRS